MTDECRIDLADSPSRRPEAVLDQEHSTRRDRYRHLGGARRRACVSFVPFANGIASLVLFFIIARRLLTRALQLAALLFLSVGYWFLARRRARWTNTLLHAF